MLKFGTSGIRDLTDKLLKDHVATQIAQALSAKGWKEVTVGRDGRTGSDKLMEEFIKKMDNEQNSNFEKALDDTFDF